MHCSPEKDLVQDDSYVPPAMEWLSDHMSKDDLYKDHGDVSPSEILGEPSLCNIENVSKISKNKVKLRIFQNAYTWQGLEPLHCLYYMFSFLFFEVDYYLFIYPFIL